MSNPQPINSTDLNDWANNANKAVKSKVWFSQTKGAQYRKWETSFWSCFSPPELCLTTYLCPCVTSGKTHHRLRKGGDMETYGVFNTSCLLYYIVTCLGYAFVMDTMHHQEAREKYKLQGNCLGACCASFWCPCSLIRLEKECELRERERGGASEYQSKGESMVMKKPA